MSNAYVDYERLLNSFLSGEISADGFQRTYLARFKNEKRILDKSLFELLDELFGDVDAFSSDPTLLAENPTWYLDEIALREKVVDVSKRLGQLPY